MRLRPWVSLATLQEAENRDYVGRSCGSFLQNDFEQGAPIYERPGSLLGKVTEFGARSDCLRKLGQTLPKRHWKQNHSGSFGGNIFLFKDTGGNNSIEHSLDLVGEKKRDDSLSSAFHRYLATLHSHKR